MSTGYRYQLARSLNDVDPWTSKGVVTFVMLNPSTADEKTDDATIRKCITFTRFWGYRALRVVNLFAFRATSPVDLRAIAVRAPQLAIEDPIEPGYNDRCISACCKASDAVVCAWGVHGAINARGRAIIHLLPQRVYHLGLSKAGHPMHPLYRRGDTQPVLWTTDEMRRAGY